MHILLCSGLTFRRNCRESKGLKLAVRSHIVYTSDISHMCALLLSAPSSTGVCAAMSCSWLPRSHAVTACSWLQVIVLLLLSGHGVVLSLPCTDLLLRPEGCDWNRILPNSGPQPCYFRTKQSETIQQQIRRPFQTSQHQLWQELEKSAGVSPSSSDSI